MARKKDYRKEVAICTAPYEDMRVCGELKPFTSVCKWLDVLRDQDDEESVVWLCKRPEVST